MRSYVDDVKLPPGYKQGRYKVYYLTQPSIPRIQLSRIHRGDYIRLFILLVLSVLIRLIGLNYPSSVVSDEAKVGTFIQDYYFGRFFTDSNPSFSYLFYYYLAYIGGYDGKFDFKNGSSYTSQVPYTLMRSFPAICGIVTILISYLTLRKSSLRPITSLLGSLLLLVENSLIVSSRFISLDSILILGVSITLYGIKRSQVELSFSKSWLKSLIIAGWGLALVISSKSSGFFTWIWAGLITAIQLWYYIGDLDITDSNMLKHFSSRFFTLFLLPVTIYLSVFYIHFAVLPFSGKGSGAFPPDFQNTLIGHDYDKQPVEVSYGSTITIKHNEVGAYLHSHNHKYPRGSKEQQVTLYGQHNDYNNEWIIETINKNQAGDLQKKVRPIKNLDKFRLYHKGTGRYLHVNNVRPPISEHDYCNEVSCNGDRDLLADEMYEFQLKILDKRPNSSDNLAKIKLRATESLFQIEHRGFRCSVISHFTRLPPWGYGQNEVICLTEPTIPNTIWYIEKNSHPLMNDNVEVYPRVKLQIYTFWKKIRDYHTAMIKTNWGTIAKLSSDSKPESWIFNSKGISVFKSKFDQIQVYFIGNVAIYYIGAALVFLIFIKQVFYILLHLNPYHIIYEPVASTTFYQTSLELLSGWLINLVPYLFITEPLLLHHYLPSVYFMTMLIPVYIDYQITKRKYFGYSLLILTIISSFYGYYKFFPIIYGTSWTKSQCLESQLYDSWGIDCNVYS